MNAAQRIRAMLAQKQVDTVGACGWLHTPEVDRKSAEEFAARIVQLTDESNWDFVKIMPNGVYNQEAHGADITYLSENISQEDRHTKNIMRFNSYLVNSPQEMERFPVVDVCKNEVYQREIRVVKTLAQHYKGTVPILPTLFTPAHCVPEFCGGIEKARWYFDNAPDALAKMLEALSQTYLQLAQAYIEAGADGFFIANRYSNADILSEQEFERFCRPFDETLLAGIKGRTWFNLLHVHGEKNFFWDKFKSYDVQAFSWENVPHKVCEQERATVEKVRALTDKILVTGTDQFADFYGTPDEVRQRFEGRLATAAEQAGDNRLIFAPGCSLPLDIEPENVHMLRVAADAYNARGKQPNHRARRGKME